MKNYKKRNPYAFTQEGSALWWVKNIGLMLIASAVFVIASIAESAL